MPRSATNRPAIVRLGLGLLLGAGLTAGCGDGTTDPHDHDREAPTAGHCGHIEADGFELSELAGGVAPLVHGWRGTQTGFFETREGESSPVLRLRFLDADSSLFAVADTCPENHLGWPTIAALERVAGAQWSFRVAGRRAGATTLVLEAYHEDHVHFSTAPIEVRVRPAAGAGQALRGRVRLTGALAGETGQPQGILRVDDAGGVRVYLEAGGRAIDSTLTTAGAWEFRGLASGSYRAWTRRPDGSRQSTGDLVIDGEDVESGPLELEPSGDLRTYPNPFPYAHGVGVEFTTATAGPAAVRILDLSGRQLWAFEFAAGVGLWHIHWLGTDQEQTPLPPGPYWALVEAEGGFRWNLVFKEATATR